MATPLFIPYSFNKTGAIQQSTMSDNKPNSQQQLPQGINGTNTNTNPVSPEDNIVVQDLDNIYNKLSGVSKTLSKLDPTMPPEPSKEAHIGESPSSVEVSHTKSINGNSRADEADAGVSSDEASSKSENAAVSEACDPDCPCNKVLLQASPGKCGLCGGNLQSITKLNEEYAQALDDLDISTQRINELAREKARHIEYIADLEARVGSQQKKIDEQRDAIAGLKNDLSAMNDKFVDQVNMTAEIAHSREMVESELEDLTQKLFSEANEMVAVEKKARFDAEKASSHLRNVISDLEMRLTSETMQSQELKERIEQMSAEYDELFLKHTLTTSSRRGSVGSHASEVPAVDGSMIGSVRDSTSPIVAGNTPSVAGQPDSFRLAVHTAALIGSARSIAGSPVSTSPIRVDDVLAAEFEDFIKQAQNPRVSNIYSHQFMKHVVADDVEPCLRFGPKPRISSRNVLESISTNRLQIEEMTPQVAAEMRRRLQNTGEKPNGYRQAMLWERFSGSVASNPNGCQACGREVSCTYRFHMGLKAEIEWIQIDTFCRDRLVAACEFYGFVRCLRQGYFSSRSVIDMYQETLRLRLCMFYARIGAYAYASELDPTLSETQFIPRGSSVVPAAESPSLGLPHPHLPYIHSNSRTASTTSVNRITQACPEKDGALRNRSHSEGISAIPNPAAPIASPEPTVESPSVDSESADSQHTNKNQSGTSNTEPLSTISEGTKGTELTSPPELAHKQEIGTLE